MQQKREQKRWEGTDGWTIRRRGGDISPCKMKRETEKISAMGRIKVKRRQGGKLDGWSWGGGQGERLIKEWKDEWGTDGCRGKRGRSGQNIRMERTRVAGRQRKKEGWQRERKREDGGQKDEKTMRGVGWREEEVYWKENWEGGWEMWVAMEILCESHRLLRKLLVI